MASYTWERITGSQLITKSPTSVSCVILGPPNNKAAYVILYDGESSSDPVIATLRGLSGESKVVTFSPALVTKRGLYIYVHSDTDEVLVQYAWLGE